jgi:hypothetical protein
MASVSEPDLISVRAYQVGFGDCLLVTFRYPSSDEPGDRERNVLIDFGSTRWPAGHASRYADIAESISQRCRGRLDALVVTHRHKDHVSGFGNAQAGATLAALKPRIVLRPWTENPTTAEPARSVGEQSQLFARDLRSANQFLAQIPTTLADDRRQVRRDIAQIAAHQLANQAAIERLDALAAGGERPARYLRAGQTSGLGPLLPGVGVHVLGPPTVEQWPAVTGRSQNDPEYWLGRTRLLEAMLKESAVPARLAAAARPTDDGELDPGPARWLIERLRDQHAHALLRIVHTLDEALNNTSLILLFQVGQRWLLFPGDAQIENWSYCLTCPEARKLRAHLDDVDLYKVGHHGSRNASPKSLVARWEGRRTRVSSIVSTLGGVHGCGSTAVPKAALLIALERLGPLFRTDTLEPTALFRQVRAATSDREPWREAKGEA